MGTCHPQGWCETGLNMKHFRRIFLLAWAMALGIVAMPVSAQTAVWPSKPVTLVVGTPAGGAIDAYARTLADQLTKQTGGTFLVENRAGAGGNLSAEHVLRLSDVSVCETNRGT